MAIPAYRNRHGELVDLPLVSATRLKAEFGEVFEQAMLGGSRSNPRLAAAPFPAC